MINKAGHRAGLLFVRSCGLRCSALPLVYPSFTQLAENWRFSLNRLSLTMFRYKVEHTTVASYNPTDKVWGSLPESVKF